MPKPIADCNCVLYHRFMDKPEFKLIAQNRKARHEYEILDTYEVGIALVGTEVKSLRLGKAQMQDSYAVIEEGELFLHKFHISAYDQGNVHNHEPDRVRKLLMHRREIRKLYQRAVERGLTLVPLKAYFKGKVAKVELALVRGKKSHDKRDAIMEREVRRELDRRMKERRK